MSVTCQLYSFSQNKQEWLRKQKIIKNHINQFYYHKFHTKSCLSVRKIAYKYAKISKIEFSQFKCDASFNLTKVLCTNNERLLCFCVPHYCNNGDDVLFRFQKNHIRLQGVLFSEFKSGDGWNVTKQCICINKWRSTGWPRTKKKLLINRYKQRLNK